MENSDKTEDLRLSLNEDIEEYNKPKLISCTKMNKYYLFPFITPIFITIRDIMINSILEENSQKEDITFYFFYAANISIFLTLGGIIYFLIDIRVYLEKKKTELFLKKDTFRIKPKKKKSKLKIFFILFLMSISFAVYITTVCLSIYHINIEKRQYTIFLIAFLSTCILKKQIYRHQKFSLLLAFCGFLLLTIVKIIKIGKEDLLSNLYSFIGTVFYSFHYLYLKYLQTKCDIPIYFSYMIVGFSSLIISIIGYLFSSSSDSNIYTLFKNIKEKNLIINLIIFIISGITVETVVAFTIYYFSAMHFVLSSFISPILLFIYNNIAKGTDEVYAIILSVIGYIIELFSILIYNEIIVLNVCDLNKYTVKGLADREKIEHDIVEDNEINQISIFDINDNYYIDDTDGKDNSIEMKPM